MSVGVAAHISAAALGGARYDVALTPAQRSHADNALWLCQTCSKLIDSDPKRFSTELLRQWKHDAEAGARAALGAARTHPTKGQDSLAVTAYAARIPQALLVRVVS